MYSEATGGSGAMLAMTGLTVGGWVLTAVGIIFLGVALFALARRHSKARP